MVSFNNWGHIWGHIHSNVITLIITPKGKLRYIVVKQVRYISIFELIEYYAQRILTPFVANLSIINSELKSIGNEDDSVASEKVVTSSALSL